ncbi:hypothetical protein L210DRAFT_3111939 [Boletus edulis BED1]|uniref:Uncharacterized protein n=1 Tax=Boletus edulis BED1 TaxID=1328754 RepID=A0AAD4GHA7_BOLED|nr:hypothetical protein L210DRAFT_3111939 [Boletus edulis BED1]
MPWIASKLTFTHPSLAPDCVTVSSSSSSHPCQYVFPSHSHIRWIWRQDGGRGQNSVGRQTGIRRDSTPPTKSSLDSRIERSYLKRLKCTTYSVPSAFHTHSAITVQLIALNINTSISRETSRAAAALRERSFAGSSVRISSSSSWAPGPIPCKLRCPCLEVDGACVYRRGWNTWNSPSVTPTQSSPLPPKERAPTRHLPRFPFNLHESFLYPRRVAYTVHIPPHVPQLASGTLYGISDPSTWLPSVTFAF